MAEYQVITEFVADTTGLKSAADQMLALGQISKKQYEEFTMANQQAEQAAKRAIAVEQALGKATQQTAGDAKKMNDTFRQLTTVIAGEVLKEAVTQLAEVGAEIQEVEAKAKTAKQELRELTNAINSGTLQGEALQTATERAAELTDQIGDARDTVQRLASDTRTFDLVAEGVRGITAAFSVAQAGAALFGKENEDLQRALLKVQAAMALATGAQELANIATTKGGIATTAYNFALQVVDKTQKALAISSAAAWGIVTAGIGLAVAGVATFIYWLNEQQETEEQIAARKKALSEAQELEEKKEATRIQNSSKEREVYYANQLRNSRTGIQQTLIQIQREKELLDSINNRIKGIEAAAESVRKDYGEQNAYYIALKAQVLDAEKAREDSLDRIVAYTRQKEQLMLDMETAAINQRIKKLIDADERLRKALIEQGDNTAQDADRRIQYYFLGGLTKEEIAQRLADTLSEADQKAADVLNSKQKAVGPEYFKDVWEQGKKASADYVESVKNDWAKLTEIINDENSSPYLVQLAQIRKAELEQEMVYSTMINLAQQAADAIFDITSQNRQQQLDADLSALSKAREQELNNKYLTEEQKAAINKKYQQQEAEIKRRAWEADKQARLEQAIINTALGVTNAFATAPTIIAAIPLAAAAAAAGAIQITKIATSKAPQFAEGTEYVPLGNNPNGIDTVPAWLTEGERVVPVDVNKKLKGIPNEALPDLVRIAQEAMMPRAPRLNDIALPVNSGNGKLDIDYEKLGKVISDNMRQHPKTQLSLDKNGFAVHVVSKGKKVEILNNRYDG